MSEPYHHPNAAQEQQRQAKRKRDAKLSGILAEARDAAETQHMSITITRVLECDYREKHFHYIVEYISKHAFNDAKLYTALALELHDRYGKRFLIRHATDPHGNYITPAMRERAARSAGKGSGSHRNHRT